MDASESSADAIPAGSTRSPRADVTEWLLVSGDRLAVSAVGLLVLAAVIWGVVLTGLAPLVDREPVLFLLFALISGNVTLITIVVSISQFVLARHLESPGEIREQLREMYGFRRDVGEITRETVLPVTPSGFFSLLFRSIKRDVHELRGRTWEEGPAALHGELTELVGPLGDHAEAILTLIERRSDGGRAELFSVLDANYSLYFQGVYRLRSIHGDHIPEAMERELTRLEQHLEQVDVARRYFKTVFIQSQLAALSRRLLYIGLPVLVVTVVLMLLFSARTGPAVSRPVLRLVIPAAVTVGFAPILLLSAYILQLATVVQRSAAMYPFTTRDQE